MPDPVAVPDGALAAQALAGREAAYGALMARHREAAYRLARSHSGDDDAALDIVQESFVAAFAALGRYDPARPFRHWLARIVLNKCRDHARRRAVRAFFFRARPLEEAAGQVGDGAPSPEEAAAQAQDLRVTLRAVAELPLRLREVLLLRTVEDLPQAEVARLLDLSEKTVETRLYRARRALAAALERPVRR